MPTIQTLKAREILDSRGNPTVEAEIYLDNGEHAYASVPSGASTGVHEALELRDKDLKRYQGKGVLKSVARIETELSKALQNKDVMNQTEIDETLIALDGIGNSLRDAFLQQKGVSHKQVIAYQL